MDADLGRMKIKESLSGGRMKSLVMVALSVCFAVSLTAMSAPKKIIVPREAGSIQKALDEASESDTIYVLAGLYKENIVMKDDIVLTGQNAENTIIHGNGGGAVVEGANHAIIKNFTIEHGSVGIICKNTNPVIEHNIVRGNRTGIHCLISLPDIHDNIIFANEWTGIYCELISNSKRTAIDRNFVARSGNCGIILANKSEVLVQNTILFDNKQYGIYVNEDSRKSRIVYNDFFANRSPYNSYAVVNETNIALDPGFSTSGVTGFSFKDFSGSGFPLAGRGKNGSNIGPVSYESHLGTHVDSDNDGVTDDVDKCPDVPEDKDGYQDEDGCPDFDNDGDGIYDSQDRCPDVSEDFDGYQDEDGCPDNDNDRDGIPDSLDKCPNTPEDYDGYHDEDGCPDGGGMPGKAVPAPGKPAHMKKPASSGKK
jgi:OmpA-OmpF porin, OOP family